MIPTTLEARLDAVRAQLAAACTEAGRPASAVLLVAVSKGFAAPVLARAHAAGAHHFGENYLQEALAKIEALEGKDITWHFQGPIQSNKTADIAAHFDWVHSVDRDKIARRLSGQRPASLAPLNVCVQVNISGEASKSGVAPAEALALCRIVAAQPRLRLRGLMAIPAPLKKAAPLKKGDCPYFQKDGNRDSPPPYRALRELYESLRREGLDLDTLSAGMSDDYAAAIAEGSTMVRIGTAIFGSRLG